jgi:hypothetical protein
MSLVAAGVGFAANWQASLDGGIFTYFVDFSHIGRPAAILGLVINILSNLIGSCLHSFRE